MLTGHLWTILPIRAPITCTVGDSGEEYVELRVRTHLCMISKVTLMQLYLTVKDFTPLNGDNIKFCCSFYVFT